MSTKKQDELFASLAAGRLPKKEVIDWYCDGHLKQIETGLPLDICLGIRGAGIRSAKNRELFRQRDILLKFALSFCTTHPQERLWNRCKTLAALIRRYPQSKNENSLLRPLFDLGCTIPRSTQGILKRVKPLIKTPHFTDTEK